MSLPSLWIPDVSLQDIHSQGEVIACLEKALVREVEQQDRAHPIKEECQKAILRVAELSSDDFHLDRHLYFSCRDDRERFCQNVRRLYRCLHDVHASGDQTQTVNAFRKYGNYTWTGFSWFPTANTSCVGLANPFNISEWKPFSTFLHRFRQEKGKSTSVCSITSLKRPCRKRYNHLIYSSCSSVWLTELHDRDWWNSVGLLSKL